MMFYHISGTSFQMLKILGMGLMSFFQWTIHIKHMGYGYGSSLGYPVPYQLGWSPHIPVFTSFKNPHWLTKNPMISPLYQSISYWYHHKSQLIGDTPIHPSWTHHFPTWDPGTCCSLGHPHALWPRSLALVLLLRAIVQLHVAPPAGQEGTADEPRSGRTMGHIVDIQNIKMLWDVKDILYTYHIYMHIYIYLSIFIIYEYIDILLYLILHIIYYIYSIYINMGCLNTCRRPHKSYIDGYSYSWHPGNTGPKARKTAGRNTSVVEVRAAGKAQGPWWYLMVWYGLPTKRSPCPSQVPVFVGCLPTIYPQGWQPNTVYHCVYHGLCESVGLQF